MKNKPISAAQLRSIKGRVFINTSPHQTRKQRRAKEKAARLAAKRGYE